MTVPEMALVVVVVSRVREKNVMWIRDNEDLQLRISMTDVFPIFWWLRLGSQAVRQKSQSTTEASFSLFFFHVLDFLFCLFGLWMIIAHSCQFHSTYVQAFAKEQTRMHTHARTIVPEFSWRLIQLHRNRLKGWRNIWQHDSTSLERLCADFSLMLRMYIQFESSRKDLFFLRRYYYVMWVNLWITKTEREGRRRINRKANKKSDIQFSNET